jgi:hypothetical protein
MPWKNKVENSKCIYRQRHPVKNKIGN